jgi:hypothetical protein
MRWAERYAGRASRATERFGQEEEKRVDIRVPVSVAGDKRKLAENTGEFSMDAVVVSG